MYTSYLWEPFYLCSVCEAKRKYLIDIFFLSQLVGMVMVLVNNSPLQVELSDTQSPLSQCSSSHQTDRNTTYVSCLQNISSNPVATITPAYDTTRVQLFYLGSVVLAFMCLVVLFYPVYKRTNSEQDRLPVKVQ